MVKRTFKVMVAGDGGVGKSTLLVRIITGEFVGKMKMTIGVDFKLYNTTYKEDEFRLALWDLGGQDHFRYMLPTYCRGAKAGLLMYDLTRFNTTMHFDSWVEILRTYEPELPILLVGSKLDLVAPEMIQEGAMDSHIKQYNFYGHLQISSKTAEGIEDAMGSIVQRLYDDCH
jgi:small GTP-binding protein